MPTSSDLGPVTDHGDEFSSPVIQEDAVLNEDGYGLRMLNGTLRVKDTDSTATLTGSNLPKIGDEVIRGSGLYISKIAKRYRWSGYIMADFEAIGIDPAYGGKTDIAWEGASTAAAEPIESHYLFPTKIGGTKPQPLNGAVFDDKGKFAGFSTDTSGSTVTSKTPMAGVRSYLAPKETNRGYFYISQQAGAASTYGQLKNAIGHASWSGRWYGIQLIPLWVPGTEGNYLLTSVSAEPMACVKGGAPRLLKIAFEITVSGNQGWNEILYPTAG